MARFVVKVCVMEEKPHLGSMMFGITLIAILFMRWVG
jgi:hypothetical protein